jgi:hypothetical protein
MQLLTLPPFPLATFRSVRREPPFVQFLRWVEGQVGRAPLSFLEVAVGTFDYAGLRAETCRWLNLRKRVGYYSSENIAALTIEGATCPVINRALRPGDVLVADPVEVA